MGQYTLPNGDLCPARQFVQTLRLWVLLIASIKHRKDLLLEEDLVGGTFGCIEYPGVALGHTKVLLTEMGAEFERRLWVWLVLMHELRGCVRTKKWRCIQMGYCSRGQVFSQRIGLLQTDETFFPLCSPMKYLPFCLYVHNTEVCKMNFNVEAIFLTKVGKWCILRPSPDGFLKIGQGADSWSISRWD